MNNQNREKKSLIGTILPKNILSFLYIKSFIHIVIYNRFLTQVWIFKHLSKLLRRERKFLAIQGGPWELCYLSWLSWGLAFQQQSVFSTVEATADRPTGGWTLFHVSALMCPSSDLCLRLVTNGQGAHCWCWRHLPPTHCHWQLLANTGSFVSSEIHGQALCLLLDLTLLCN